MIEKAWSLSASLAAPALRAMLHRRARRGKEIADRLPERYGIDATPRPSGKLIWLHAASVGETVSLLPLLRALADRSPAALLLTTGTVTSAKLLDQRLPERGLADRVLHRFVPLDVPRWVANFLDHWRPDLGVLVESELWPNLIAAARARRIPLALINARMSSRSLRGWQRAPGFARTILDRFDLIDAQSPEDAARLTSLGAPNAISSGNLKFSAEPLPADETALAAARAALAGRPVWVAASLHPGEDEIIRAAHTALRETRPDLTTILVPRHPERGPAITQLTNGALRSAGQTPAPGQIWIADTLNELGLWYRLAPIALVGRSLVPPGGGQNPLEPARLACAVATGPFTANFTEPVRILQSADALQTVTDAQSIAAWVGAMLADPAARTAAGNRAAAAVAGYDHLPARLADTLLGLLR